MADLPKLPGIPSISPVKDTTVAAILRPMKESLEILGSAIAGTALPNGSTITGGFNPVITGGGGTDTGYDPATDYTPPPAPTGLTISAGFTNILLSWNEPNTSGAFRNYAYAEIWRSPTNVLGSAVLQGFTVAAVYADPVGTSKTYYYWIRFVSQANVAGPYNSSVGTIGGTGLVGGVDLSPLIITAEKIANGAIDLGGTKITGLLANANMAVISDPTKIADYIISNTKLADLAVEARNIQSGAVSLTKFASGIEPVTIVTGSLPTTKSTETIFYNSKLYRWNGTAYIATVSTTDLTGTVTDAQIAGLAASKVTGTLTDAQLAAISAAKITGQITSTQITDGAISTPKLAAGSVTAANIAADTIVAANIAAGAITSAELAAGAVIAGKIAAGTIQAVDIAANTITAGQIAANTITAAQIASDTITAGQIAAGAITATELAANAVTAGKIAVNTIFANDGVITNGAITNALIANAAVGSAQIVDAAITSAKIGNLAVGSAAIQNGAIVNAKIADLAVDDAKVANLAASKLTAGSINVGQYIQSTGYSAGVTGWYIGGNGSAEFGSASIRGLLTASQIDSRNLTIKDSSGTVLFGSGTNLDYSYVGGVKPPSDATRNRVYSQSTQPSSGMAEGDLWNDTGTSPPAQWIYLSGAWRLTSTVGATFAASVGQITGQISSTNISTYIAGAAIGTAYIANAAITNALIANAAITDAKIADLSVTNAKIANLAVDSAKIANLAVTSAKIGDAEVSTLKIAGNAVTVPANGGGYSGVNVNKSGYAVWQDFSEVYVDFGSIAPNNVLVLVTCNLLYSGGSGQTATFVRVVETVSGTATLDNGITHTNSTLISVQTNISGTFTGVRRFVVQISQLTGGPSFYAGNTTISVQGAKR